MDSRPPAHRIGRPPLGDGPSAPVNVRMAPAQYDAAHARATRERCNVPELVRRAVSRYLQAPDEDADD